MNARVSGMGGHHSAAMLKDEWLTPPEILRALGPFDLDPCAPINRPWEMAAAHYTVADNGLMLPWTGRVWLNPPYGLLARQWLNRLAAHGNGVALIFARTETDMFFDEVWNRADAILFLRGRLYFHHVSGERASANAGAPSVLVAYGQSNVESLRDSGIAGRLVALIDVKYIVALARWGLESPGDMSFANVCSRVAQMIWDMESGYNRLYECRHLGFLASKYQERYTGDVRWNNPLFQFCRRLSNFECDLRWRDPR